MKGEFHVSGGCYLSDIVHGFLGRGVLQLNLNGRPVLGLDHIAVIVVERQLDSVRH